MLNERYFSNIRSLMIPLYGFKGYHHANSCEDDIQDFIGRSSIIDKLKAWLRDSGEKYAGAYLVTGYRGMGKSSFVHKSIKELQKEAEGNNKCTYVPVSINVGNDLMTPKALLAMICKLSQKEFDKAIYNGKKILTVNRNSIIACAFVCIFIVVCFIGALLINVPNSANVFTKFIFNTLKTPVALGSLAVGLVYSSKIGNYILYRLWRCTGKDKFITISQIHRRWRHLLERINAEVTFSTESGATGSVGSPSNTIGLNFKLGKEIAYPIADVPEMQELLVKLLDLIHRHKHCGIRFIFVIDELDKISPKDDERSILPEYDTSNIVNGNSTYRSRQKALASLIANMKYFISSSYAKFIFITGYDMYEATLADISNREFNIHSIFNGQLNVSSFFRRTEKYSGVDSMIEEYLSHLLYNKIQTNKSDERDKPTLHTYSKWVKSHWQEKETASNREKIKEYKSILERRVVFLHSFLTYLVYMSNGSPKKLAMFIEKFVRTKENIDRKVENAHYYEDYDFLLGVNEPCEYYLYFDSRNLMRIGFVNYLVYPMIQNLIDKSNIYNDKLLVSTSFMISNLYKFHKSGFSMRNLEYMPELLDINRMPELRDFIGGIISFLVQTHIDINVINLYKYKFPLRLSEEITFFSKTSEEISYLFNFSHDELLSVKNLYMLQLEHYKGKQEASATASLHHMLGDIYMLEEDYEQAIYEFQEALSAVSRQHGANKKEIKLEKIEPSKILFFIRLSLKLGLAYEKRKTFDTAYLTYENLVCTLLKYVEQQSKAGNTALDNTKYKKTLFEDIRIMYLVPLAKLFVLEKMDLGGFTADSIFQMEEEFDRMTRKLNVKERNVVFVDYFAKCGDVMFYRNLSDEEKLQLLWNRVNKTSPNQTHKGCKDCRSHSTLNNQPPCSACICYSKSILTYLGQDGIACKNLPNHNFMIANSLHLLSILLTSKSFESLTAKGYTPTMAIAHSLVGLGNSLLACAKDARNVEQNENTIVPAFTIMNKWRKSCLQNNEMNDFNESGVINIPGALKDITFGTFTRAIISYWSAARVYAVLGEYKSAYTLYCQILDSLYAYYRNTGIQHINQEVIDFCQYVTEEAIRHSYEHYGHINAAEIDKMKRQLNVGILEKINLDYISNFPDIEAVIYRYYQICLLDDNVNEKKKILSKVLDSNQLGRDKLISSLSQDVQNLYFKTVVNEQILLMLMPQIKTAYRQGKHRLIDTLNVIDFYLYDERTFDEFFKNTRWSILDKEKDKRSQRLELLQYLVCDTLFCLNKISDLLSPLYSTTLYSNEYIAEIYDRSFIWNHFLICLREILNYVQTQKDDKQACINALIKRYHNKIDKDEITSVLINIEQLISDTDVWKKRDKKKDAIEEMYDKICPSSHRYLTSSYLIGNALDFYHKAIEMHTSGKAYKEMMTTLFFLEDDLRNDSCYLNFAIEMYLQNTGYIEKRIKILEKYYLNSKELFEISNYLN